MTFPNFAQPRPLRFLLYLEWILLGIVMLGEVGRVNVLQLPRSPLLNLVCLGLFALMGLRLPTGDRWVKVAYTVLEFALILLMTWVGGVRLMPLLYVVFVIRNCFIFEHRARALMTLVAFLLVSSTQYQRLSALPISSVMAPERMGLIWLSMALLFGLVVLFLQLLVDAVLAERRSREKLAIANTQLREYVLKIESIATLQERNRIAREIHDSLGHSLTAFNLHLEAALRLLKTNPEDAIALLQDAQQLGSAALQDVRHSVATLRTEPLQGVTLEDAIANLRTEFQRSTGIEPELTIQQDRTFSLDLKIAIYRIIQEALTNICKYAQASKVTIQVHSTKDFLQLTIEDNGQGFDPTHASSGYGLRGMQERTIALNGSFEITTAPHAGCRIQATFPITGEVFNQSS